MQDIYKLTDSKGETRYEMMSGERAQRKNHKREENKLATRWLPVELEDVPNDAEIRDVSGKMINAGELKGEDLIDDSQAIVNTREEASSQPSVNPPAVDSPASNPPMATQTFSAVQTPVSVAPAAGAEPTKPTWHKGEPATMTDDALLAVWMEYETDPRKDSDIPRDEWNYRQDVRAEYQERARMDRALATAPYASSPAEMPNGSGKASLAVDESAVVDLVDTMTAEARRRGTFTDDALTLEDEIRESQPWANAAAEVLEPETIQTYQLVGTARVVQMTASEAKLLNANMDGEWIYAPELKQFAVARKPNGEPKKRQKWRGISGTNLLMLCGSEGLSQTVAKETVKRLTGLDAADSTASVKMSEGRKDDTDLPDPGREGWAEFYHTVGEVKKALGENGHKPEVMALTDSGNLIPVSEASAIGVVPADYVGSESDKEIGRVQAVISAYCLKFQTLLDEMQDELMKVLRD